jgi:hypoxanthine phosphoribosyltransferase
VHNLRQHDIQEVVVSPVELEARVKALGRRISRDYRGRSVLLVGVLKGVTFFLADLMRHLSIPVAVDYLSLARYADARPGDRVRIVRDLDCPVEGRHVIIVKDIVNTGLTVDYLLQELRKRNPESLEVAALLDRPARRLVDIPLHYSGFQIPNHYVVGYGLDYRELYRNLPFIAALKTSVLREDETTFHPQGLTNSAG